MISVPRIAGQRDVAERLPRARAVHLRRPVREDGIVRSAASRSSASSGTERHAVATIASATAPGRLPQPVDRLVDDAEPDQDPVHDAEVGVEDEPPEDPRHDRRDRPRHQHRHEQDRRSPERPVEDERRDQRQRQGHGCDGRGEQDVRGIAASTTLSTGSRIDVVVAGRRTASGRPWPARSGTGSGRTPPGSAAGRPGRPGAGPGSRRGARTCAPRVCPSGGWHARACPRLRRRCPPNEPSLPPWTAIFGGRIVDCQRFGPPLG